MLTLSDDLITLREAAALLPRRRGRKRPHFSTLWRWALRGVRGVKLETVSVGDTLCTSPAALEEFLRRVTEARGIAVEPTPAHAHHVNGSASMTPRLSGSNRTESDRS
jgi:hypothetical protein